MTTIIDPREVERAGVEARADTRLQRRAPESGELLLQTQLIQLDDGSRLYAPLGLVWERMVDGSWSTCESFTTSSRFYFLLRRRALLRPLGSDVLVLRRTLLGERQKVVAIDIHRSNSTVTSRISACLANMGFHPRVSRVPALLVAAAAAAAGLASVVDARITKLRRAGVDHVLVSTPRLDEPLSHVLTPTEFQVIKLLVNGSSHRQIAAVRGSSTRPVANHISAVFRKLGGSGRSELLLHLVLRYPRAAAPTAASGASLFDESPSAGAD